MLLEQDDMVMHPAASAAAAARMAAMGEAAYMDAVGAQAVAWIAADPGRFVVLSLRRLWLCFFPARGMLLALPGPEWLYFGQLQIFGVLRLAAVVSAVLRPRGRWVLLGFALLPLLPYIVSHVTLRYLSIVVLPSVLLIGVEADHWAVWLRNRVGTEETRA